MSILDFEKTENPCKKFIERKNGNWQYYDKETKTNITVPELRFIVVDELSCITGFNDNLRSGIYSNEVHDLSKQELNVKSFKPGIHFKGLYADIKDSVTAKSVGGQFTKSVYCLLAETTGMTLACIKMSGAVLGGWIEKGFKTYGNIITIDGYKEGKKGSVIFQIPIFISAGKVEGDVLAKAKEQATPLIEFLKQYENSKSAETKSDFLDAHSDEIPQENNYTEGVDYEAIAKEEISEDNSVNAILTEDDGKGLPF